MPPRHYPAVTVGTTYTSGAIVAMLLQGEEDRTRQLDVLLAVMLALDITHEELARRMEAIRDEFSREFPGEDFENFKAFLINGEIGE